tara:strand:+ start:303 stop:773 length:471 start_codon:yes stop_codon:yes gene_type:complete
MKIIKLIIFVPFLILLISSCSYQKMNSIDQKKFHIQEFEISGDKRDSFVIQKKILRFSNENSINKIKILINLKRNKSIKEKNIQNKVVKYDLTLMAEVTIIELNTTKEIKRVFTANETYNVDDSYSNTVNNSKAANNSLIDRIVDEILDQLRIYYS